MQNRVSLPIDASYLDREREPKLSPQQRAIIDWAEVDDHQAILDTHCADGNLLAHYKRHYGVRACGIVTEPYQEVAVKEQIGHLAEILRANRLDIPWRTNSFHAAFVTFPLQKHQETAVFLRETLRVLKANGQLLISLPCVPWLTQLGIRLPERNHSFMNPYQLMEILEACGFADISMRVSRLKYATVIARKPAIFSSDVDGTLIA